MVVACPHCARPCRIYYDLGGRTDAHRHHQWTCPHCGRDNSLSMAGYLIRVVKAED
jgi:hypothetical protein